MITYMLYHAMYFMPSCTSARQRGQRQSPGGISASGGVRQYVWNASSQPSHSSISSSLSPPWQTSQKYWSAYSHTHTHILLLLLLVGGVRRMNKVNALPARLVPGWVTVFGGGNTISVCNKPTRSTQPCIPPGSLNRAPASAGVRAGMSPLPSGTGR